MSREHVLRPALWTAAFFDLAGACGWLALQPRCCSRGVCSTADDDKRRI
jgi:hypothetical protein